MRLWSAAGRSAGPGQAERDTATSDVGVVIVTGSCCIPGFAPFDAEAERRVREAIATTGIDVEVRIIPATAAMSGAMPRRAMTELLADLQSTGRMPVPAVFVRGERVGHGVPDPAALVDALRRAAARSGGEG